MKLKNNINYLHKIVINLSIYIVIIFSLIYFILLPKIKEIKKVHNDIVASVTKFEKDVVREKKIIELNKKVEEIMPKIEILNKAIISSERQLEVITTLEKIAQENGVKEKLNLSAVKPDKNKITSSPIELNVDGTYGNLLAFLIALEQLDFYINPSQISISSSRSGQAVDAKTSSISMRLVAETYWK